MSQITTNYRSTEGDYPLLSCDHCNHIFYVERVDFYNTGDLSDFSPIRAAYCPECGTKDQEEGEG